MSNFQRQSLPPALDFYERKLGRLSRPNSKGWAQARCPFHHSKGGRSFSVNLESGGFHCFGCDAHGDMISFVMQQDGVSFKQAAEILGCWRDVGESERSVLAFEIANKKRERDLAAKVKEDERLHRLELRDEILSLGDIQREMNQRLIELRQRAAAPVCEDEEDRCWHVMALVLDDLQETETKYMGLIGMEYVG